MLLGLVSDTHGYLGDDACRALAACDRLLHAGDVGANVLEQLRALAPLTAVRGNTDTHGDAAALPEVAYCEAAGYHLALVHRLADAPSAGWDVLVYGHCHRRHADCEAGRLLINPGAAGRRGFHRERSVALLSLEPQAPPRCRFVILGPRSAAR
ncbi:MAG: metallophosphoesterase family protein [Dehalococcoidia bacterium]|nr:metallophosphoesterase family protein [Dehalococcoidia bacterium]